jgi:hypothetical protein
MPLFIHIVKHKNSDFKSITPEVYLLNKILHFLNVKILTRQDPSSMINQVKILSDVHCKQGPFGSETTFIGLLVTKLKRAERYVRAAFHSYFPIKTTPNPYPSP